MSAKKKGYITKDGSKKQGRKMNAAERKRKSQQKMKEDADKWLLAQEKQRKWDKNRKEKNKRELEQNAEMRKSLREKRRLLKRKQREKKKLVALQSHEVNNLTLGSYKCTNTMKRAVVKAKKAQPQSPSKQKAFLWHMVKDIWPQMAELIEKPKTIRSTATSEEVKIKVKAFYEKDDISRCSPNRIDTMSVKDLPSGKRIHVCMRHMMMTIAEAYSLFVLENPDIKLSKSKFFEYRPLYVRPINKMPYNTCVCIHHASYNLLIEALN